MRVQNVKSYLQLPAQQFVAVKQTTDDFYHVWVLKSFSRKKQWETND
jgi:hypothetical protein